MDKTPSVTFEVTPFQVAGDSPAVVDGSLGSTRYDSLPDAISSLGEGMTYFQMVAGDGALLAARTDDVAVAIASGGRVQRFWVVMPLGWSLPSNQVLDRYYRPTNGRGEGS